MKKKLWFWFLLLCILFLCSCSVGRYPLSLSDIIKILSGRAPSEMAHSIFYSIRLSRTFLVVLCGGALSLSGMTLQTIFRNPLVSPDILGISSGCSVGAAAALVFFGGNAALLQGLSFFSGLCTVYGVVFIAKKVGGDRTLSTIIAGIILSAVASSMLMLLKYIADPNRQLPAIEFWLMGGFQNANYQDILFLLPLIFFSVLVLFFLRFPLKLLSLGDEEAQALGVSVNGVRLLAVLCATVLVSTVVSVAGVVSWIGLIAPHIVRIYVGDDIVCYFFISFLCGSSLLLFADILSRSLFSVEIPISILTALFGACFLFYFLCRKGGIRE